MSDKEKDKRLIIPKDTFEEEASEGLGRLNREEVQDDLRELRARLDRRIRKPWMVWLPAAAAVVLLLITSTIYVSLFRGYNFRQGRLALREDVIKDTLLIAMAEPIVRPDTLLIAMAEPIIRTEVTVFRTEAMVRPTIGTVREKETVSAVATISETKIAEAAPKQQEEPAEEIVAVVLPRMEKAAIQEKNEQVTDMAVAAASPAAGIAGRIPLPVGGMEEFNDWIQKNIRYPENFIPGVKQVVVVTFRVAADSSLYDLKVEKSPGDQFTREAFRLLREGPRWVPVVTEGRVQPEEARVAIEFK